MPCHSVSNKNNSIVGNNIKIRCVFVLDFYKIKWSKINFKQKFFDYMLDNFN
jgi:hypothetical protein